MAATITEKTPAVQIWCQQSIDIVKDNWGVKSPDEIADMVNEYNRQRMVDWKASRYRQCDRWSVIGVAHYHLGFITKEERDELRSPGITERRKERKRLRANNGYVPASLRRQILNRDRKCLRCGATQNLTVDHIVPVGVGGTSAKDNLQTLCKSCNSAKSMNAIDYRPLTVSRIKSRLNSLT